MSLLPPHLPLSLLDKVLFSVCTSWCIRSVLPCGDGPIGMMRRVYIVSYIEHYPTCVIQRELRREWRGPHVVSWTCPDLPWTLSAVFSRHRFTNFVSSRRSIMVATSRGIPVVVDAEKDRPHFKELLPLADCVICNRSFPQAFTGRRVNYCTKTCLMCMLWALHGHMSLGQGTLIW